MNQSDLKKPATVALWALFLLCVGAVVFYKERLFADTSYIAFNVINHKSLYICNQRYGSFITQLVPYFAQKLHLPLKIILASYALSFNLFFFIVAVLLYRFRQFGLAILMAFYYFLLVSDSYFLANDELHQAVAWMFLTFGVTIYLGNKKVNIFWVLLPFLLLMALTLFTHFVVFIPTFFLFIYLVIDKKNWPFSLKNTFLLGGVILAILIFKTIFSGGSQSYEKEHIDHLTHLSLKDVIYSFSTPVIYMFLHRCLTNYWVAVFVLITGIVSLARNRQKGLIVWVILSCIAYFISMGLVYGWVDKSFALFHIETEWQCIGILFAAPFVFTFLPSLKPKLALGFTVMILLVRSAYISAAIPAFAWRVDFNKKVLSEMRRKNMYKLAFYMDDNYRPKYILDWTSGYESLFESATDGDTIQRTFAFVSKGDKDKQSILLSAKNGIFLYDLTTDFNKEYFTIDTTHAYQITSFDDFFK